MNFREYVAKSNVQHPGSRGGHPWWDGHEWRYDNRPRQAQPEHTEIVIEAPNKLLSDPRLDRYEQFAEWLKERVELPPGEVVVECADGDTLPRRKFHTGSSYAVGVFTVNTRQGYPRYWHCGIALGPLGEDEADQQSRLTTLAHELLHMSSFYQQFGATPGEVVDRGHQKELLRHSHDEDTIEDQARSLTDQFLGQE